MGKGNSGYNKARYLAFIWLVVAVVLSSAAVHAQRQMEDLGRGLVVLRPNANQAYVSWRLLGSDPEGIAFNLYRAFDGGAAMRLNATPLTTTTDFTDTIGQTVLNSRAVSYFVRPVLDGVELEPSRTVTLRANSPVRSFIPIPLRPIPGASHPYGVKFAWVGDLNGDGEFDFAVDRLSTAPTSQRQFVDAYLADGTFLWRVDMGPNSLNQDHIEPGSAAISVGHSDHVTVFDLDGNGHAEVIIKTANGTVLGNGAVVTAPNDNIQFISILDGMTGAELARAEVVNPYIEHGPLSGHFGIMYADGVRPTFLFSAANRRADGGFNSIISTWDFRGGQIRHRWTWTPGGRHAPGAHQIRFADVTNDGRDEFIDIGFVLNGDGEMVFNIPEVGHGDRFHTSDIDPNRPGLETYLVQQDNQSGLGAALVDSRTGEFIHKWYAAGLVDVGRGVAIDIDPNHFGKEMVSTLPGIFNARGEMIFPNIIWPTEGVWWDGDLSRELIIGTDGAGRNPAINKFDSNTGHTFRLLTLGGDHGGVHQAFGARPAFWGDILGDWREEIVLVANDFSEFRIYATTTPATTRLYTLMHNPQYRVQATTKGYVQSSYPDFFLGTNMDPPPPPPMVPTDLIWRGGATAGANTWSASAAAWENAQTGQRAPFASGQLVRFDISGRNDTPVSLEGELRPGKLTVFAPQDFRFTGPGSLSGAMRFIKVGAGTATFDGAHTFTGATTVWDGALHIDGSLSRSPVRVWGGIRGGAAARGLTGGRLGGSGEIHRMVTLERGAAITPGGGMGNPGKLRLRGGLTMNRDSVLAFDLSSNPTGGGGMNDSLAITGDLLLRGPVTIHINRIDGRLSPGSYLLVEYSGNFIGSIGNLSVAGLPGEPFTLARVPGEIRLEIPELRAPGALTWIGGGANVWDTFRSPLWRLGANMEMFIPGDLVQFTDAGAGQALISLEGTLAPGDILVESDFNYTFQGRGEIHGASGLTKRGAGTLTLNDRNHYTGPTRIDGGTLRVARLADGGMPSPIGSASSDAANLVLTNGGVLSITGSASHTNRNLTLGAGGGGIHVASASGIAQFGGIISGPGRLTKTGPGILMIGSTNTFTGGSLLSEGEVRLSSWNANQSGLGTGAITFNGGRLVMNDIRSHNNTTWDMIVPAGATGRLDADGRSTIGGRLLGGGTFTFMTPFVRTNVAGNWAEFTGRLNVVGVDFRVANAAGMPRAHVDLASGVFMYSRAAENSTIPIGALSGESGSTISAGSGSGEGQQRNMTLRVGGRGTNATFAGRIQGTTRITKEGIGTWTLTGANTYTGATSVTGGYLIVDGSLGNTTVTVSAGAGIGGRGGFGGPVTMRSGSHLRISGEGSPNFTGSVNIEGVVRVTPAPGAAIPTGSYTLFTYSGALAGQPSFQWSGPAGQVVFSRTQPGVVTFTVTQAIRAPAETTWIGGASNVWDGATINWRHAGAPANFVAGDVVTFDDVSSRIAIDLPGIVWPGGIRVDSSRNYTIDGSGVIAGEGNLVKDGTGRLTLRTGNAYQGGTVIRGGILALGQDSGDASTGQQGGGTGAGAPTTSLGVGPIFIHEGGELRFGGRGGATVWTFISQQPFFLNGGVLRVQDGQQHLTGALTVEPRGATFLTAWHNKNLWISGPLQGNGPIVIDDVIVSAGDTSGAVTRVSSANNPYSGIITINRAPPGFHGGGLRIEHNLALPHATIISNNTTVPGVVFTTSNPVIGALAGGGNLTLPGGMLVAGGNHANTTYDGVLSGSGGIEKTGKGTWTLTANHQFAGPIIVRAGTLEILGSVTNQAVVEVMPGATLRLTGTLAVGRVIVHEGGTLEGGGLITAPLVNAGLIRGDGPGALWRFAGGVENTETGFIFITRGARIAVTGPFENRGTLDLITSGSDVPGNVTGPGVILTASNLPMPVIHSVGPPVSLSVRSFMGHGYRLQRSTDLKPGSWENVGGIQFGAGDVLHFSDPSPPESRALFYRIAIDP